MYPIETIVDPDPSLYPVKQAKDIVMYKAETRLISAKLIMNNSVVDNVLLAFFIPFLYNFKQFWMIAEASSSFVIM